jgi:modulator of FtsH protease HflC
MNKNFFGFFILGAFLFLGLNAFFTIDERKQAIVFQFGRAVKTVTKPGLAFKIPMLQNVEFFDKRILDFNISDQEVIAFDKKRIILSAFTRYKISDPLKYYQTVGNEQSARARLKSILESSMRQVVGRIPLSTLLTDKRSAIMSEIEKTFDNEAKRFGIEVIDVRTMRADLPKENSQAIYKRMQAERAKEAKEFRARGAEEAARIRAIADKDRRVLLAEAEKKSQILRGEGDAVSNKIYAEVYSKDPEFFEFYRTLQAYKETLSSADTKMILSLDSEFMKVFENNK